MLLRYNLFTILWAVIILLVTLTPGLPLTSFYANYFDKVAHALIFAVLTLLMIVGFLKQHSSHTLRYNAVQAALIIGVVYGVLLELSQYFIPTRDLDYRDIIANVGGCVSGYLAFLLIYKL